ncbi:hypothetical protein [Anabaena azotica]|uniref:Uncharacterized protein n=1 Tax=Anabaena azotica FACHB-119 TaxID=947527 RepID=A0ABR8DBB7_9NOST|nr:hypothetical protein [Anabaena azotica]MBD2503436.1 hypothetical protein [Anabaena azotica FACHB-119]
MTLGQTEAIKGRWRSRQITVTLYNTQNYTMVATWLKLSNAIAQVFINLAKTTALNKPKN